MEALLVGEGLGPDLERCEVDVVLPRAGNLELLELLVAEAGRLVCLEPEAQVAERVVNVDPLDAQELPLAQVVDQEARRVEYRLVEDWPLDHRLVALLDELVDQLVRLVDLRQSDVLLKVGHVLFVLLAGAALGG